ncbi:sulfite exporter TauE/SafE family protein [Thiomicrorhabdus indica]|uniref:sulfite exporter TauE/SafE family protein n=1 Tax=Thiomicrorhabdus indica TaxID=2267253 RepID=UPI002AA7A72A|nr:sulfite exporter TauE/SafE family protein [Thiomicrorhabdus indica]
MDISVLFSIAPLLIAAGIVAGLLAGLLGVGGGIVLVPVLYFIFQNFGMDAESAMKLATGTSLAAIVPTSMSSIRSHYKKGNIHLSLIKSWALWIVFGVIVGASILSNYQSDLFIMMFALIAGWVSYRMFFNPKTVSGKLPSNMIQKSTASVIGGLSVMVGIGGGTLGVPILSKFGFKAHHAVGTSAVFGLIIALPGALIMLFTSNIPAGSPVGSFGSIHLLSLVLIVPLTVFFAPIGVKIGQNLNPNTLKKVFAVVLFITSIRMLTESLGV